MTVIGYPPTVNQTREPTRIPGTRMVPIANFHNSLGNSCMVDELRRPGTIPRGSGSSSWPASAHLAPAALIQSLQWLRERVLERLDALETLTQQRSASASAVGENSDLERALERKRADLEETERRLCTQAERQEKEWRTSLAQLEADRRLLAEAWERIEQERIAYLSASEPHHHSHPHGQGSPRGSPATRPHTGALVTARLANPDPNHPVAQEILRQFQTLCSDVRRNAEDRRDSRPAGKRPES
jgi:hypothetical protein